MNPRCATCEKTVYPMEKLNCLDKIWHKGCFRCTTCGMTLNMKNYKGYNKMPYCAAHYPTTSFTSVADTPENRRLAKNTTNQSSLQYHAEFEKQKGTKLNVADDLETLRASKSAQIASDVSYRGVRSQREQQEAHRPDQIIEDGRRNPRHQGVGRISDYDPAENNSSPYSARSQMPTIYDSNKGGRVGEEASRRVGKISDYDPTENQWAGQGSNQYNPSPAAAPGQPRPPPPQPQPPNPQHTWQPPSATRKQQKQQRQQRIEQQEQQEQLQKQLALQQQAQQKQAVQQQAQRKQVPQQQAPKQQYPQQVYGAQPGYGQQGQYKQPGMYGAPPPAQQQPAYHHQPPPPQNQARPGSWNSNANNPAPGYGQIFSSSPGRDPQQPWPSRQVPQQYRNSSSSGQGQQQRGRAQGQNQPSYRQNQPAAPPPMEVLPPPVAMPGSRPGSMPAKTARYRAVYDYTAADEDEISFTEGDVIIEVTVIDEGWMEGRNQRTGQYGMLPSNYLEKV